MSQPSQAMSQPSQAMSQPSQAMTSLTLHILQTQYTLEEILKLSCTKFATGFEAMQSLDTVVRQMTNVVEWL